MGFTLYRNKQHGTIFVEGPDGFARYWNNHRQCYVMSFFTNKDLQGDEFQVL